MKMISQLQLSPTLTPAKRPSETVGSSNPPFRAGCRSFIASFSSWLMKPFHQRRLSTR
jgi:hypothetical protein